MTAARGAGRTLLTFRRASLTLLGAACAACVEPPLPEWHDEGDHRWREVLIPRGSDVGFTSMESSRTGLDFVNSVETADALANRHLTHGSGVALGDVDGDGRLDIVLARIDGPNALYHNLGGWRFEDVTEQSGIAAPGRRSTGAVLADVDGDGDLDLLLTALGGPNALFLNDGSGSFVEVGAEAGLESESGSTTMTLADVEGDGDLDLYITNYKAFSVLDVLPPEQRTFDSVVEEVDGGYRVRRGYERDFRVFERRDLGSVVYVQRGEADAFYLNDGHGRFEHVPFTGGRFLDEEGVPLTETPDFFGLSARFYDVTGNGAPDLYVANDFEDPDQFWLNDGNGTFRAAPRLALRTTSNAAMAVDFADIDRDGDVDFFEVDMLSRDRRLRMTQTPTHTALPKQIGVIDDRPQVMRNTMFLNRGDGTFAQMAELAGVDASEWSWGTMFMDVDLDGYEDILVATGHIWDIMDADTQRRLLTWGGDWREEFLLYPDLEADNVAFRNRGDLTFEEVGAEWGFALGDDISHGIASGDLDGDGDLDVVVTRLNDPVLVLRNDAAASRLTVRLLGRTPNTQGIGAKVLVRSGSLPEQSKEVTSGGMYLSGSEALQVFAADSGEITIEVRWRSGGTSVIDGVRANRLYEIREPAVAAERAEGSSATAETAPTPFFEDVSFLLGHRHVETPFDETRQQLLPNGLDRLGPGVTWYDVDDDGDVDLLIPSGRGGRLGFFRNDAGRFTDLSGRFAVASLDQSVALPMPTGSGTRILIGRSSYEAESPAAALAASAVLSLPVFGGVAYEAISGDTSSVGALATADIDSDGDLDLFVGGRLVPAAYPLPATSRLFLNEGGVFVPDVANRSVLESIGLVSAATFADIDGDGDPDLLLAREWAPLELLRNDGGVFLSVGSAWGLAELHSRWNGVATGDLDGDGRLDVVATSWGRNTRPAPRPERPLVLYFGDLDRSGSLDLLLVQRDARLDGLYPLQRLPRLLAAMPFLGQRVGSFSDFASATVQELFGEALTSAGRLEVNTYEHTLFLNRGDHFEAVPLPVEAQLAPAFYVGIADFDGDGNEDVFLSQNFFPTEIGAPRYDGGRGLWLRGDGTGGLVAVPGQESGIRVYGDGRGAALGDFDGDARVDLAVAQNGAATRLFRNVGATPGLRVRLVGPAGNPRGIGAWVRLVFPDGAGPVREITAGSGYWSVDSAVPVLGGTARATAVRVRWPGGPEVEVPIPEGAIEVTVRYGSERSR